MDVPASLPSRPGRVPLIELVITETLDTATIPRLRDLLDEVLSLQPERLVVDLAGCPDIDAAAITVLLQAHQQAIRGGGHLELRVPPGRLHRDPQLAQIAHQPHVGGSTATVLSNEWSAAAWTGALNAAVERA